MALTRVFMSFDYDYDDDLRKMLLGQAKLPESPFEIADWSLKEPLTGDWEKKIVPRIRAVSTVAVICGHNAHLATGISAEIKIAREQEVPYFLLAGRADGKNTRPTAARSTDKLYKWTWQNLTSLIAGAR